MIVKHEILKKKYSSGMLVNLLLLLFNQASLDEIRLFKCYRLVVVQLQKHYLSPIAVVVIRAVADSKIVDLTSISSESSRSTKIYTLSRRARLFK